ncbi:MAG: penicillin-binding protein [Microscillaceae bacterium]|jgi:penicillin-binding protein 1A|nr:penicillin-binding protein [Microscillaceae bacterium]
MQIVAILNQIKSFFGLIFYYTPFHWRVFWKMALWQKLLSLVGTFIGAIVLLLVAIEINFLWLFGQMPNTRQSESEIAVASEIYTHDKVFLGKYFIQNRTPVAYSEIAPSVVNALIATEDVRFYDHYGIDFTAFFSAMWATLQGDARGGSTITQQLAKNLFRTRETSGGLLSYIPGLRTLNYKLKEWITAVKLEFRHNKQEILTMYLNTVDFGNSAYGIRTAARTYFDVLPKELDVPQAATLIGILKATTIYNPIQNPENSRQRRNVVLGQMKKYNYITTTDFQKYLKNPLTLKVHREPTTGKVAPYFKDAAAKYLVKWCEENNYDLYTDGLKIYTTIDSKIQAHAEAAVKTQMKRLQERFYIHWAGYAHAPWQANVNDTTYLIDLLKKSEQFSPYFKGKNPERGMKKLNERKKMKIFTWEAELDTMMSPIDSVKHYIQILQTGLMAMDPRNGYIKAWVGGINHHYFTFDHVIQAKRQPGSTFKPIVYTEAFEQGMGPCDRILDAPHTVYYTENGEAKTWSPNNSDFQYTYGNMTLRKAMATSRNTVTARLMDKLTPAKVRSRAQTMGIQSKLSNLPALGLGSSEVSLYEMVGVYGAFMNNGIWNEPQFIARIEDRNGKVIYEASAKSRRVMSEETAFLMVDMFRGTIQEQGGTSQALWEFDIFRSNNEIGGKTGTSSNYADGWYMGVTHNLVTGVWVGADDHRVRFRSPQVGEASQTALPVFGIFMENLYKDAKANVREGRFPENEVKTQKPYGCLTPYIFQKPKETEEEGSPSTDPAPSGGEEN